MNGKKWAACPLLFAAVLFWSWQADAAVREFKENEWNRFRSFAAGASAEPDAGGRWEFRSREYVKIIPRAGGEEHK